MSFDARWRRLRERCDSLDPDAVLVTPGDERVFAVDRTDDDGIFVTFREGRERTLRRDQFEALADRVESDPLELDSLPPGVGPYVAVLSLVPGFDVDDGAFGATEAGAETNAVDRDADDEYDSPFVRSRWDVRRPPESVHDDALLLADWLERHDATDLGTLSSGDAVDLYVLLSDVQRGADRVRGTARNALLERLGPGQQLHGRFGTVRRTTRERRIPKDDETIFEALDERDIPRAWVTGVDPEKLDVVLAVTDLDETEVYDVDEQVYAQKTGVDEDEKFARLRGLAERLEEIEGGEEIHDDLLEIERRIDEALSAG